MNTGRKNAAWVNRLRGRNNEGVLALTILVVVALMTVVNPDFFTVSTLFSILRNSLVETVFALGVLIVIVSGGIDVSFPVIGIFAGYTTIVIAQSGGFDPGVLGALLIAVVIGSLLGLVNGGLIARFGLPTLIVTLGTQGIFRGVLLAYIGSRYIAELPAGIAQLSTTDLFVVQQGQVAARLHVFVVPVVLLCLAVHWLLQRTVFGRGVYALGGDAESARRAGFPVVRLQLAIYALVGLLAGIAGIMHVTLSRNANPYELAGTELDIIAAVVLGGASILGGRGSVLGTVLGVVLIAVIKNSLILMGVPGTWQRAAVGVLLVAGVSIQALGARRKAAGRRAVELEEARA
ncbi:ABC transporter permease [Pseudonocardia kunmingensis]|uniref:Monosaccharide ABC transporter membrane protein (CUT2 family) n=1 Tax=Pseudonocardia kunmingensis TaxID=630975 RepID=A0A543CYH7_9PSEU|nr:ABC transporter permease [Pseudonocardia kunmingensis]TQM02152.1 monosaccharide ABC transporter membrane protein (CUT2 family) [Pseudonocardia kunmingensis]